MAQQNYDRQAYGEAPHYPQQYGNRRPAPPARGSQPPARSYRPPTRRRRKAKRRMRRWWILPLLLLAIALALTGIFRLIEGLGGGDTGVPGTTDVTVGDIQAAGYGATLSGSGPWVVALDAGHGGGDIGAEGLVPEVELNDLTVARLYALLEADPDFTPVLTRQAGQGATPKERVKAAKAAGADLFLSVHGNSDSSSDTSGFECFPAPPGRKFYEGSLAFATLVSQEMGAAGARLRGEAGVRFAYYDSSGTKYFIEASDTTVQSDKSFGVVEGAGCPAVLAEQCFITSAADMELFGGDAGAQRVAECYHRAISSYFKG